ncbi:hypothetical protein DPMN_038932 [Dreissena polymorpha]|uniref:Uncharacterized protein n=1 Tax=Dreissena polymorpha TaxID=45954 RepID=A0A9D4MGF7_DREPO|nr:hypothetical protein DPMN_038932 [Dreissena polymorpha]
MQALNAAATVFNPTVDMSDAVQQTLENKIRQLRTPADWLHPIPPPLPHNFDVMPLVMAAYYGTPTSAPPNAAAMAAAAPVPHPRANPGPPTAIRRGMRTDPNPVTTDVNHALIQSLVNNQSPATREALLRALLLVPNTPTSGGGNFPTGPLRTNSNPWPNPQTAGNTQLTGFGGNAFGQLTNPGNAQHSVQPRSMIGTTPPTQIITQTADPFFSNNPNSWWF